MFFARTINLQNSLVSDFPELVKGIHFNHTKAIFGEDMNLLRGITLQSRLGWCFGLLVAIGRYHAVDAQSMFINAGSDIPYTDGNGNTWVPDSPYVNSGLSFTTGIDIEGTDLDPLYQSERYDPLEPPEMMYSIDLDPGVYSISLHFAEIYFGSSGARVFGVVLEGEVFFSSLDIFKEADGAFTALVKSKKSVSVTDGTLNIEFIRSLQNNPKIQGIEIHPADPASPIDPSPAPFLPPTIAPPQVSSVKRINAGGSEYIDPEGNVWEADTYYSESGTPFVTDAAIAGTKFDSLFESEIYGPDVVYNIPLPLGEYSITLHWAEIYFTTVGARVFNVFIQGALVAENLDIVEAAGRALKAYLITETDVAINDGILTIELVGVTQNAKISAIEISSSSPQPTEPAPSPETLPPVLPRSSAIYINFGGDDYLDEATGIVWKAGAPFTNGGTTYTTAAEIKDTLLDPLYQSELYDTSEPSDLTITIPVAPGFYDIYIHLAEIYFKRVDARVFAILLNGELVFDDVDIFRDAGNEAYKALIKSVMGFSISSGELIVSFNRTAKNNPKIQGIEIRPNGSEMENGAFQLEMSDVTIDRSSPEVFIKVVRVLGSKGLATIDYMTRPDTATAGDDYIAQDGRLTFEDGVTEQQIIIPLVSGTDLQPSGEQFNIVIDNPVSATLLAPRTATITLLSDSTMLPNYADFSSNEGLKVNGDAKIIDDALRLTENLQTRQAGSVFYDQAISLADNGSFRSVFSFRITGSTGGAHGLTFTFQNDSEKSSALGSSGPGMGFEGISKAVAIEFDTRGSLSGERSDNHVAIIVGSVTNELAQVPATVDLNDGSVYHAWVDYNGISDSLSIYLSDSSEKPPYLLAEAKIDLEAEIGAMAFFGFTGGTGAKRTNAHEVLTWQLDQLEPSQDPPKNPDVSLQQIDLITGLSQPISLAWLPDETMLIAQKSGIVRVASGNALDVTPFLDISGIVNGPRDRGLLDIATHPDFFDNPYVYLLFTYEGVQPEDNEFTSGLAGPDGVGNRAGRLIRVTADVDNNYRTALAGSEVILLGKNSTRDYFNAEADSTDNFNEPPGGILRETGENVKDFIASDCQSHTVGGLVFSPIDGALFVSTGDGSSYNSVDRRAFRVQDIDNLSGKLLRIDSLTGEGLPSNPYYEGDASANRAKVYQLGYRNPWRLSVDASSGRVFIGDVGWSTWEEINSGDVPGANQGWPFFEGGSGQSLVQMNGYANTVEGREFFAQESPEDKVVAPIYALNHQADGINAIVLGAKLNSDYYGEDFQGDLFLNDLGKGTVRHVSFDASGNVESVGVFANDAQYFVKIAEGPDGALYYCALVRNRVGRWELV